MVGTFTETERLGPNGHGGLSPYNDNPAAYAPLARECHAERDALHLYVSPEDRLDPKGKPQ